MTLPKVIAYINTTNLVIIMNNVENVCVIICIHRDNLNKPDPKL